MLSFYITLTINAHLIEQNIFNKKLQVVYLVLKQHDSNQRNLHLSTLSGLRLYFVFSIWFSSKCIIIIVRRMFNMPSNCLLQINLLYNPKLKFMRLSQIFVALHKYLQLPADPVL